ncbi:GH25 family lysozyme [Mesorhizobium sp. WSM2239]|uniref:GH25 family lysozyme n=2 Tax=unclassified Mesorhizobium TaxID=325217 RepID=A0AAU8D1S1_9HYPH
MRSTAIVVSLLACLGIAGCTSSSGIDGLAPSLETTSSIPRPDAAVPQAEVGAAAPAEAAVQTAQVKEIADASVEAIALVAPPKPTFREVPFTGGKIHRHRFRDAKPINFGQRSPQKLAVHGVDVSRWQGEIDWPKLRSQGANFAYIKATDGGDHLDPMFRKNWRAAHEAGLRRGAYHFFYWCRTAGEQADWFIRNVPKVAGALPPVIDVEWNGESKNCRKRPPRAKVLEKMQVFMDKLEAHYGQRPIIYTAPDFYRDNLTDAFPNHPFWLRSVAAHPSKVYPDRKWVFWQYSGSGLSHGVEGRIDLNVFHGDESEWRAWLGRNAG